MGAGLGKYIFTNNLNQVPCAAVTRGYLWELEQINHHELFDAYIDSLYRWMYCTTL